MVPSEMSVRLKSMHVDFLHGDMRLKGQFRRETRCLAEHHVLRLHAQRRIGDVTGRERDRHQKIGCFG